MESNTVDDAFNEVVDRPLERDGGYLHVRDRPGIGFEIDESEVANFFYQLKKIAGNIHAEGSVAH